MVEDCVRQTLGSGYEVLSTCERKFCKVISAKGWKQISYKEWRPVDLDKERKDELVICVHGLSRNACDFDYLGVRLSSEANFRVLSIDVVGRGKSDWMPDSTDYGYPTYVNHSRQYLSALVSRIYSDSTSVPKIYWIGTSMGGLIGMMLSASLEFPVISKLVLNDIGPFVSAESIKRLATYCGKEPLFDSRQDAMNYLKTIYEPFGCTSDHQWECFLYSSIKQLDNGKWQMSYDPKITNQISENVVDAKDVDLFSAVWDKIPSTTQILLIKGQNSDILTNQTVAEMKSRGPGITQMFEYESVGHAPALLSRDQTDPIIDFLSN